MKRIAVLVPCFCLALLTAEAGESASSRPASNALQTVQSFLTALSNANVDDLVNTLSDDATVFMPTSDPAAVVRLVGKSAIGDRFRPFLDELRQSGHGPPYMTLSPRDLLVQDFGDCAVVTFHLGKLPTGEGRANFSRRTFVVRRTDAGWRIVHFHGSNVLLGPSSASEARQP